MSDDLIGLLLSFCFAQHAGRMDIPVALGIDSWGTGRASIPETRTDCGLAHWAAPATMDEVIPDGVSAMREVIARSPLPITVVSLAPMCNVAALVKQSVEDVLPNAHLVRAQLTSCHTLP